MQGRGSRSPTLSRVIFVAFLSQTSSPDRRQVTSMQPLTGLRSRKVQLGMADIKAAVLADQSETYAHEVDRRR